MTLLSSLLSHLDDLDTARRRNRLPPHPAPEPLPKTSRKRARQAAFDAAWARREAARARRRAEAEPGRPVEPVSHAVASPLARQLEAARSIAGPAEADLRGRSLARLNRRPAPVTVTTAEGGRHVRHFR
jgi:hypothetical protein